MQETVACIGSKQLLDVRIREKQTWGMQHVLSACLNFDRFQRLTD
jgi:hypothetical protein